MAAPSFPPISSGRRIPDSDPEQAYDMSEPRLGHAVIINNVHRTMVGSRVDVTTLEETYRSMGFSVTTHRNCDVNEMARIKRDLLSEEMHRGCNAFLVTIICHGDFKGQLYDCNEVRAWRIEEFIRDLNVVDNLRGKPKIVVLQCCRGRDFTRGSHVPGGDQLHLDDYLAGSEILPNDTDMFLAFATAPGYSAHAGDEHGSHYLQSFATYLRSHYMSSDLDAIYNTVTRHMADIEHGSRGQRQVSEKRSTLRYKLRFSEYHNRMETTQSDSGENRRSAHLPSRPSGSLEKTFSIQETSRDQLVNSQQGASPAGQIGSSSSEATEVKFVVQSTHDTGLVDWPYSQLAVFSSGEVVIWGKQRLLPSGYGVIDRLLNKPKSSPAAFHIFARKTKGWEKLRVIKSFCDESHENHTVMTTVPDSENSNHRGRRSVACSACQTILEYKNISNIKQSSSPNKLVSDAELFSMTKNVHLSKKYLFKKELRPYAICLIPGEPDLRIYSCPDKHTIRAVVSDSEEVAWEKSEFVDGFLCSPHGMCLSGEVLLVADGKNARILAFNAHTGQHQNTIAWNGWDDVRDVCAAPSDQVIVLHINDGCIQVSILA